jgi:hypothetical protein
MSFNEFIRPVVRLAYFVMAILGFGLVRRTRASNTCKLFFFFSWCISLLWTLNGCLEGLDAKQVPYLDPVVLHLLRTEMTGYYAWIIERYYIFATFGLAVLTSRFLDALQL